MDSSEDEVNNGVLTIPEYVVDLEGNKYPVKVIEEGCFSATATNKTGTNLKKVSLPEQLVKIGRKAFFDTTNLADFHVVLNLKKFQLMLSKQIQKVILH